VIIKEELTLEPITLQVRDMDNSLEQVALGISTFLPFTLFWSFEQNKVSFEIGLKDDLLFEKSNNELDIFNLANEDVSVEIESAEVIPEQLTELGDLQPAAGN